MAKCTNQTAAKDGLRRKVEPTNNLASIGFSRWIILIRDRSALLESQNNRKNQKSQKNPGSTDFLDPRIREIRHSAF